VAPKGQPHQRVFRSFTTVDEPTDTMPAGSEQLKPSFNESAQNWLSAPKKALPTRQRPRSKTAGCVMTTITSESLPSAANSGKRYSGGLGEIRAFWHQFFVRAFHPYRPELHYMRGPGPACRAKQKASSPAIQSMAVDIRAAKALRTPAHS